MNENKLKDKGTLNVLWVDDNAILIEAASILVELIGHKCTAVMSGKDALEHINNNTYDIVFTDIGMPKMNGWELAAAIREKLGNKIKIVAVTGWDIDQKIKEEPNIDFAIQKPFTLDALRKTFLDI